jgi:E3 ubiquitin-protein ligase UBR4
LWLTGFNVLFILAVRRRQHLAMSHEKDEVTVLQLSSLLKQADAPKKKLTLKRLSTAPVPFIVLSMAINPGRCTGRLRLERSSRHDAEFRWIGPRPFHPQLEMGNFIIKAVWLPASKRDAIELIKNVKQ